MIKSVRFCGTLRAKRQRGRRRYVGLLPLGMEPAEQTGLARKAARTAWLS